MWVFGAPIMSASVTLLNNSYFARSMALDTLYLQIATVSDIEHLNIQVHITNE